MLWMPLLGGLLPAALAGTPPPPELAPVERPVEDVLVLALVLDQLVLRDALLAYSAPGGVLLPLGLVAAALDFAVTADPASGLAEGWLLAENRRFVLDVGRRRVLVEGRPGPYEPSRIEIHGDDIYVDSRLLCRWWPVDLVVDLARMEVRVRGREKLPIESRREREERRRSLLARGSQPGPRFERQPLPYLPASWPLIDGRLQASASRSEAGTRFETRHDLLLTGDLAWLSAELFVSGVESSQPAMERSQRRLRLGRRDHGGALLGPLRARELFVGDLLTPGRPLVSRSRSALGLEVSSFPLDRLSEPHRTDLHGETLPGWEVELYRNDALLDFRQVGADGRYAFEDVPLVQGLNLLRRVFYGPQGQRREEVRRLYVQPGSRASEGLHYRLALYQQNRSLFPQGGEIRTLPGGERLFFELETPVGRRLTLLAAVQSLVLEDGRHTYPSVEVATRFGPLFGLLDLAADIAGGWAARTLVQTHLGDVDLLLEDSRFFDFRSEGTQGRAAPRRRTTFRAEGQLGRRRWGFLVEGRSELGQSGERTNLWSTRLSAPPGRLSATLDIDWEERRSPGGARHTRTEAGLLLSAVWHRLSLRGAADARLRPADALRNLALTAGWALGPRTSLSLAINRSLAAEPFTSYGLGLAHRLAQLRVGGGLRYEDRGVLSADVSVSFGLGRDPHSRRWRARGQPMARRGAAAVRVFLDRNGNGRPDGGEEPLSAVRLTRDGYATGATTDELGRAWLTGLSPFRQVDIGIAVGSLEDPYWLPARAGVGLVPRPGRIARIDLPVVIGGEIDGVVALRQSGAAVGAANVRVELSDEKGEIQRFVETAFDGFYLFDAVPPGRYRVQISPAQLERRSLSASPPREVLIDAGGSVVSGVDFSLECTEEALLGSALVAGSTDVREDAGR